MCVVQVQIAAYTAFDAETSMPFISGLQRVRTSDAQSAALFDVTEIRYAENAIHAVKAGQADNVRMLARIPLGSPSQPVRP